MSGSRGKASPLIVVGFDDGDTPQFILPLILERRYGAGIAAFFGGSHSNLNMPVFAAAVAAELTPDRLDRMLREIAPAHGVDLFALTGQPPLWQGVANPLAALPFQRSADDVYFGTLAAGRPPPRLPSGMRKKERQLSRMPDSVTPSPPPPPRSTVSSRFFAPTRRCVSARTAFTTCSKTVA